MADDVDLANEHAQKELDALLTRRSKETLVAKGVCYDCGEPVKAGLFFCDAECRDDYEWYHSRRRQN